MEIVLSPAKINIGLWITGKRPDNYHNIYSYVHKISLYDKVYIKPSHFLKVRTSNPNVPEGEENIVYKAVKAFENYTGLEATFDIFIEKNIPIGSGLGGGSSNAAAVLNFINKHFNYPLTEKELIKIANSYGLLDKMIKYYNDKFKVLYPKRTLPRKTFFDTNIEKIINIISNNKEVICKN